MKAEGFVKTAVLSSLLLASPFSAPARAEPHTAAASSLPETPCTIDGRRETDGRSLNGDRALRVIDALIRHRLPSSEAERLRPCLASDYEAAENALNAMPPETRDDETPWIEEFIRDAGGAQRVREFRTSF